MAGQMTLPPQEGNRTPGPFRLRPDGLLQTWSGAGDVTGILRSQAGLGGEEAGGGGMTAPSLAQSRLGGRGPLECRGGQTGLATHLSLWGPWNWLEQKQLDLV